MRTLRVGIASYEQMKARTMAIAGRYTPAPASRRYGSRRRRALQSPIGPQPRTPGIIAASTPNR